MYKQGRYEPSDILSDVICSNYTILLVLHRFGISLGIGDDTIERVCNDNGVDVYTFLSIVNVIVAKDKNSLIIEPQKVSLELLVAYLKNSHCYYLTYRLPKIRKSLIEALNRDDDATVVIVDYYDQYMAQVEKHMTHEEKHLFPYINALKKGENSADYSIEFFSQHHEHIESKLTELKNILIKYYTTKTTDQYNSVLYDIFNCERDLAAHNSIEDYILVPAIANLEQEVLHNRG